MTLIRVDPNRVDPNLGTVVHVVGARQSRPNLPSTGCPFCVGGLEAPEPYEVRWFPNRWPAMDGERCEVVLYTPDHDATFASLGVHGARRVIDLWAERTVVLGARTDVDYVLVFENRGPEVGATIAHPHGQIYAYDHVPSRPWRVFDAGWSPDADAADRLVVDNDAWIAYVPYAATYPLAVTFAPKVQTPDLARLDEQQRDGMAAIFVDVLDRLDRLYDRPLPFMLWVNQRPCDGGAWSNAWCHVELVSPWRDAGVARYIAAAEVACDEYFNPVEPEWLAAELRRLRRRG